MTIIERDIELYTGFLEKIKHELCSCLPEEEAKYKELKKLHENVLDALIKLYKKIS